MIEEGPEELATVWNEEVRLAFESLTPKHQAFLLEYLKTWNASAAYRAIYNPMASPQVSSACGSRVLGIASIQTILKRFQDTRTEDLFLVKAVFKEAATEAVKPIFGKDEAGQPCHIEDIPDYDVRVKGATQLAKLSRLFDDPEETPEHPEGPTRKVITFGGMKIEVS